MSRPLQVLVLEDNADDADLMILQLRRAGFEPSWKRVDTEEDYQTSLSPDLDVILADYNLPHYDGLRALSHLRERGLDVPFIIVSGNIGEALAVSIMKQGAADYLLKDKMARLGQSVEHALHEKNLRIKRKQAEDALKETEEMYHQILDATADMILCISPDSKIVWANKAFRDYHGMSSLQLQDVIGVPLNRLNRTEQHLLDDVQVLAKGRNLEISAMMVTRHDGKVRAFDTIQSPILDAEGKVKMIVAVSRDVTERNQAMTRLRHLNEMQAQFVAEASHELRTPLTIIKESVLQVLDGIYGQITAEQREILALCMEGIDRLKLLVDDLLDLSKMEAGKFILNKELFNGVQLLEQIRSSFATQASAKGLEVRLACPPSDVLIYADRGRILQILTNLVGNAIKFTDKGHIELSLGDKDNQIECSVADTGVGIAEEDLPKMFSKFQQFGGASTGMVGGTGLGLSIAKNLVELHRGAIRVESALNRGTRFTFTLPKVGENEIFIESVEASVADARQKGEELLLLLVRVEDDSSSNLQKGEAGMGNALYKAMERLAVAIRRLGFTNSQGKDCIVVYGHVGKASAPEAFASLWEMVKRCIFECNEHLKTAFGCGWSVYPRDGATVQDLLKTAQKSLAANREAKAKKRIMIVDDEAQFVDDLWRNLRRRGHENVVTASDGVEALEKITVSVPDVILLDMNMPKMSGYEVIGRLKQNSLTAKIPILILSGYDVEAKKLEAHGGVEAIPTLTKPVSADLVERWVRYLL
jgi:PAS domain S-box-containing protein